PDRALHLPVGVPDRARPRVPELRSVLLVARGKQTFPPCAPFPRVQTGLRPVWLRWARPASAGLASQAPELSQLHHHQPMSAKAVGAPRPVHVRSCRREALPESQQLIARRLTVRSTRREEA